MKIYEQRDRKFKPQSKPFKQNSFTSLYKVYDQSNNTFYAKFFYEAKVRQLSMFQATEYNQTILSDLSDQIYPQNFLNIQYTYSTPEGFIFVTQPYQITLDQYMKSKVIEQVEALQIFQQCMKAVYSLYMAGFWHRNIRPEHFVRIKKTWKLQSIVYSESIQNTQGVKSQYLWDSQYQPPQAYEKLDFTDQYLDNLLVWNMGSLLVDMLLSYHKLKDKTILDKFKDEPFNWKAIGIKKKFTKVVTDILGNMLHYDQNKRMKISDFFSNENLSKDIANHYKNSQKKERIYVTGQSYLAKASFEDRSQQSLLIPNFKQQKEEIVQRKSSIIVKKNSEKIQTNKEIIDTIKNIAKQDLQIIQENVYEQSSLGGSRNRLFEQLVNNPKLSKALQVYKCHYDKCQLMQISSNKLERLQQQLNVTKQMLLLNKYAILFVSQLHLNQITDAMNKNLNLFQLEPQVWSQFQSSIQFKGFKEILNFRYNSRKIALNEIKQQIIKLSDNQKQLLKASEVHKFVYQDDKAKDFQHIKLAYRKIVKTIYDIVSAQYNKTKSEQMARLGMYITYCMTVDKLYIGDDIPDNFAEFFTWINQPPANYISLQEFQEYLDNADKLRLLAHSSYVLKKYFKMSDFGQSRARI